VKVEFIASIAVVTANPKASRKLYVDALGLPLQSQEGGDYYHSEKIGGSKHFGVWPLTQAAQACFGRPDWPPDRPTPQASIEFEVASAEAVAVAAQELQSLGYPLLHEARVEPWGQTVARLLSPENLIVGVSFAPSLHETASA
jgi:catechol 2,3-dioxygenase-like lactoylglutathione lyase family enzyme